MKKIALSLVFMLLCMLKSTPLIGIGSAQEKNESRWIYEFRAGLLAHDTDHIWNGNRKEHGVDINAEIVFSRPSVSIFSSTVRPNFGLSVNTNGDTSKIYGGLLWEFEMTCGLFLNLGVGAALHDGTLGTSREDKRELGSRILFRIPVEIGYTLHDCHRVSIAIDHVSNAGLADHNEGLNSIGLLYGYRF